MRVRSLWFMGQRHRFGSWMRSANSLEKTLLLHLRRRRRRRVRSKELCAM